MNKTKTWFQKELVKYRNDPEFLREYILLLEGEIEYLTNRSKATLKLKNLPKRKPNAIIGKFPEQATDGDGEIDQSP